MFIHGRVQKSKPRKIPKKQREQYQEWLKSVESMSTNFSSNKKKSKSKANGSDLVVCGVYVRETQKYQSLDTGIGTATKSAPKVYTGTAMKGIATMHKSNAVPVFTDEQAKDIASMRR